MMLWYHPTSFHAHFAISSTVPFGQDFWEMIENSHTVIEKLNKNNCFKILIEIILISHVLFALTSFFRPMFYVGRILLTKYFSNTVLFETEGKFNYTWELIFRVGILKRGFIYYRVA